MISPIRILHSFMLPMNHTDWSAISGCTCDTTFMLPANSSYDILTCSYHHGDLFTPTLHIHLLPISKHSYFYIISHSIKFCAPCCHSKIARFLCFYHRLLCSSPYLRLAQCANILGVQHGGIGHYFPVQCLQTGHHQRQLQP